MPVAVSCATRAALTSLIILTIIGLAVIFGPHLSQYTFDDPDWGAMQSPPDMEAGHYFGTDSLGRDLFVRTLLGGRISLMVGIMGAMVAVIIGTLYGAASGFIGGRVDSLMMRVLEILNAFPFMFFVIMLVTFFGRNLALIFIAIGAVSWLDMARIVRGPDSQPQEQGVYRGGPRLWRLQVEDHHPSHRTERTRYRGRLRHLAGAGDDHV